MGRWGGEHEAWGSVVNMLQTWQLELNLAKVIKKEIKKWKKAGKNGND